MTKILVVEDDRVYAAFLNDLLPRLSYNVVGTAYDGTDAIQLAIEKSPDVILMDIVLAEGMDGVETARQLRKNMSVPIIFISAHDSETILTRTREFDADAHLIKPVRPDDIRMTIESVLLRRKQQESVKEAEERISSLNRIASMGAFAGGIAHEFNSLLTVILGYAKFGQKQVAANAPVMATLKEIYETARNAANLTRQIMAFSSNQMYKFAPVDLGSIVKRSLEFARSFLGTRVTIVEDIDHVPITVMADAVPFEQALINLYRNAIEAITDCGTIEVRCHCVQCPMVHPQGRMARITIRDTGIGIPKDNLGRIFDPFFTTKPLGTGKGLGLSVAHGIVRQHKGLLRIESEQNMGTLVEIDLPMVTDQRAHDETGESNRRGTILIAEDTELLRKMLHTILTDMGFDILLACDGDEAVEVFRANATRIDLVLLDMIMPKKTGREVFEILAQEASHTKFLLSSGYTNEHSIVDFARTHNIELVPKPYDPDDLAVKISALLATRTDEKTSSTINSLGPLHLR